MSTEWLNKSIQLNTKYLDEQALNRLSNKISTNSIIQQDLTKLSYNLLLLNIFTINNVLQILLYYVKIFVSINDEDTTSQPIDKTQFWKSDDFTKELFSFNTLAILGQLFSNKHSQKKVDISPIIQFLNSGLQPGSQSSNSSGQQGQNSLIQCLTTLWQIVPRSADKSQHTYLTELLFANNSLVLWLSNGQPSNNNLITISKAIADWLTLYIRYVTISADIVYLQYKHYLVSCLLQKNPNFYCIINPAKSLSTSIDNQISIAYNRIRQNSDTGEESDDESNNESDDWLTDCDAPKFSDCSMSPEQYRTAIKLSPTSIMFTIKQKILSEIISGMDQQKLYSTLSKILWYISDRATHDYNIGLQLNSLRQQNPCFRYVYNKIYFTPENNFYIIPYYLNIYLCEQIGSVSLQTNSTYQSFSQLVVIPEINFFNNQIYNQLNSFFNLLLQQYINTKTLTNYTSDLFTQYNNNKKTLYDDNKIVSIKSHILEPLVSERVKFLRLNKPYNEIITGQTSTAQSLLTDITQMIVPYYARLINLGTINNFTVINDFITEIKKYTILSTTPYHTTSSVYPFIQKLTETNLHNAIDTSYSSQLTYFSTNLEDIASFMFLYIAAWAMIILIIHNFLGMFINTSNDSTTSTSPSATYYEEILKIFSELEGSATSSVPQKFVNVLAKYSSTISLNLQLYNDKSPSTSHGAQVDKNSSYYYTTQTSSGDTGQQFIIHKYVQWTGVEYAIKFLRELSKLIDMNQQTHQTTFDFNISKIQTKMAAKSAAMDTAKSESLLAASAVTGGYLYSRQPGVFGGGGSSQMAIPNTSARDSKTGPFTNYLEALGNYDPASSVYLANTFVENFGTVINEKILPTGRDIWQKISGDNAYSYNSLNKFIKMFEAPGLNGLSLFNVLEKNISLSKEIQELASVAKREISTITQQQTSTSSPQIFLQQKQQQISEKLTQSYEHSVMAPPVVTSSPDTSLQNIASILTEKKLDIQLFREFETDEKLFEQAFDRAVSDSVRSKLSYSYTDALLLFQKKLVRKQMSTSTLTRFFGKKLDTIFVKPTGSVLHWINSLRNSSTMPFNLIKSLSYGDYSEYSQTFTKYIDSYNNECTDFMTNMFVFYATQPTITDSHSKQVFMESLFTYFDQNMRKFFSNFLITTMKSYNLYKVTLFYLIKEIHQDNPSFLSRAYLIGTNMARLFNDKSLIHIREQYGTILSNLDQVKNQINNDSLDRVKGKSTNLLVSLSPPDKKQSKLVLFFLTLVYGTKYNSVANMHTIKSGWGAFGSSLTTSPLQFSSYSEKFLSVANVTFASHSAYQNLFYLNEDINSNSGGGNQPDIRYQCIIKNAVVRRGKIHRFGSLINSTISPFTVSKIFDKTIIENMNNVINPSNNLISVYKQTYENSQFAGEQLLDSAIISFLALYPLFNSFPKAGLYSVENVPNTLYDTLTLVKSKTQELLTTTLVMKAFSDIFTEVASGNHMALWGNIGYFFDKIKLSSEPYTYENIVKILLSEYVTHSQNNVFPDVKWNPMNNRKMKDESTNRGFARILDADIFDNYNVKINTKDINTKKPSQLEFFSVSKIITLSETIYTLILNKYDSRIIYKKYFDAFYNVMLPQVMSNKAYFDQITYRQNTRISDSVSKILTTDRNLKSFSDELKDFYVTLYRSATPLRPTEYMKFINRLPALSLTRANILVLQKIVTLVESLPKVIYSYIFGYFDLIEMISTAQAQAILGDKYKLEQSIISHMNSVFYSEKFMFLSKPKFFLQIMSNQSQQSIFVDSVIDNINDQVTEIITHINNHFGQNQSRQSEPVVTFTIYINAYKNYLDVWKGSYTYLVEQYYDTTKFEQNFTEINKTTNTALNSDNFTLSVFIDHTNGILHKYGNIINNIQQKFDSTNLDDFVNFLQNFTQFNLNDGLLQSQAKITNINNWKTLVVTKLSALLVSLRSKNAITLTSTRLGRIINEMADNSNSQYFKDFIEILLKSRDTVSNHISSLFTHTDTTVFISNLPPTDMYMSVVNNTLSNMTKFASEIINVLSTQFTVLLHKLVSIEQASGNGLNTDIGDNKAYVVKTRRQLILKLIGIDITTGLGNASPLTPKDFTFTIANIDSHDPLFSKVTVNTKQFRASIIGNYLEHTTGIISLLELAKITSFQLFSYDQYVNTQLWTDASQNSAGGIYYQQIYQFVQSKYEINKVLRHKRLSFVQLDRASPIIFILNFLVRFCYEIFDQRDNTSLSDPKPMSTESLSNPYYIFNKIITPTLAEITTNISNHTYSKPQDTVLSEAASMKFFEAIVPQSYDKSLKSFLTKNNFNGRNTTHLVNACDKLTSFVHQQTATTLQPQYITSPYNSTKRLTNAMSIFSTLNGFSYAFLNGAETGSLLETNALKNYIYSTIPHATSTTPTINITLSP